MHFSAVRSPLMASEVHCLVVGAPPAAVNVPTPTILPVPLSATPGEHDIILVSCVNQLKKKNKK